MGVDDGDLSMLRTMSSIHHLVDSLLEGLGDPGVLADIHHLCLLDQDIHKQTKAELAHLLSSLTRHAVTIRGLLYAKEMTFRERMARLQFSRPHQWRGADGFGGQRRRGEDGWL